MSNKVARRARGRTGLRLAALTLGLAAGAEGAPLRPSCTPMLPITYIQSGFTTDDPPVWPYRTRERKRLRVEAIAQHFDGAEVLNLNLDTESGRRDVRDLAQAMQEASEALGKPFIGFWSFPRLPGFFRPQDVARQPADYRAFSLKADGSLWRRLPSLPEENESKIKFTGEMFDLTNEAAVRGLLDNLRRVFAWDGPEDECLGPLPGYIVLNECMLSSNWESIWSPHEKEHDVASADTIIRCGRKTHRDLFVDDDPRYSYLNPAKRCAPLFSRRARDSFAAFARARWSAYDHLPADRDEFNDDDATVHLPAWVAFVDTADSQYWRVWEQWVFETWTGFIERVARAWCQAQEGNPAFRGVIYFQLPMWYSLREASRRPVTYAYCDKDGELKTETVTLAEEKEFAVLNPVVMGTDMERLLRSPWFAGMVHETTKSIHVRPRGQLTDDEFDAAVEQHPRFRHYFMAQGALARRVCHENGKLFGAFARSQHFRGHEHLSARAFRRAFDHTITPLRPDIIATIGPWFADAAKLSPEHLSVLPGVKGYLARAWREKVAAYRARYKPPAAARLSPTRQATRDSLLSLPESVSLDPAAVTDNPVVLE